MILHLGVLDQPYDNRETESAPKRGKRRAAKSRPVATTGDVATILEDHYAIMETFWERHGQKGADALAEGLAGQLENLILGAPVSPNPFAGGEAKIEEAFHDFILTGEMEGLGIEGVPTAAALKGVNHRLKHPYAKDNPARVSFRDTGLYEASFKAWIE